MCLAVVSLNDAPSESPLFSLSLGVLFSDESISKKVVFRADSEFLSSLKRLNIFKGAVVKNSKNSQFIVMGSTQP